MHYWNDGGSTPWGMWVAMVVMMTVVVAVAWVIVTMVRHGAALQTPHQALPSGTQQTSAAAILDERFARGEIDADEYTHRKATLHSPTGTV